MTNDETRRYIQHALEAEHNICIYINEDNKELAVEYAGQLIEFVEYALERPLRYANLRMLHDSRYKWNDWGFTWDWHESVTNDDLKEIIRKGDDIAIDHRAEAVRNINDGRMHWPGTPGYTQPEVFPPGTRVRVKGAPNGYVFLICVGGYVCEDNWIFSSMSSSMDSDMFERVP